MEQQVIQISRQQYHGKYGSKASSRKMKSVEEKQKLSQHQQPTIQQHKIAPNLQISTLADPKVKQNLTAAQQHLTEVKGIFSKVDNVLKDRKEICEQLKLEILDLQGQLEFVQKTVKEHAEASAIQQSSLDLCQSRLEELEADYERVKRDSIDPMSHLVEEINKVSLEGQDIASIMIAEVNQENDKLISVKDSTENASNLMERVISKHRLLETGINNIQNKLLDLNEEKKQKMESLKELNQVLVAKEEYAQNMKEEVDMSCNDYLSLLHREALTLQQIDNMKLKISKSNDHLIHIQEQSDKFMETHNNTLMELETKIKQTELQNESCKVQLEKLDLEIEQAKAKELAAEQALKIARDRFEALEQEEKELDVAIENAQQELSRQVERENEVTANIERLKMEIESVIAENQHDYERTCQALKEVHELQSDCAQLNCQLEALREERDAKLKEADEQFEIINHEIKNLEQQLHKAMCEEQLLVERASFQQEDILSINFENSLRLIENKRIAMKNEEISREIMEQEDDYQRLYVKQLKLFHVEEQIRKLKEEENRLQNEFDEITTAIPEEIELTEDDLRNIEDEVQREMIQIYMDMDAEFESKKMEIQTRIDEIANISIDSINADLIGEIAELQQRLENEKNKSTSKTSQQVNEQPWKSLQTSLDMTEVHLPITEVVEPLPIETPSLMLETFPLSPPKEKSPKVRKNKSNKDPSQAIRGKCARTISPNFPERISQSTINKATPMMKGRSSKPVSTDLINHQKEETDSMDAGLIPKHKSSRRLIGQFDTSIPAVTNRKKPRIDVAVPKSSLDDWFNDNCDI